MNNEPYYFVKNFTEKDVELLNDFKHRTFNVFDLQFFILQLQSLYKKYTSLEENIFEEKPLCNTDGSYRLVMTDEVDPNDNSQIPNLTRDEDYQKQIDEMVSTFETNSNEI